MDQAARAPSNRSPLSTFKRSADKIDAAVKKVIESGVSFWEHYTIARPAGLAFAVIWWATGPHLIDFAKFGDFSYGIYILHFAII